MKIFIVLTISLIGIVAVPTVFAGTAPSKPALYFEMTLTLLCICLGIFSAIYPKKFANFNSKLNKYFHLHLHEEMWQRPYMLTFTRAISIFLVFIGIALLLRDFIVI